MSEQPISISNLNDYIFCPVSIYFHSLEEEDNILAQDSSQLNGTAAHKNSDNGTYSSRKSVLQGISVYCEEYNLIGKIDIFDSQEGILTERKKRIKTIYDGYIFQLYGQYYALSEMGYSIKEIRLYSMDDNKVYPVLLPENNPEMQEKFEHLLQDIYTFDFSGFVQTNPLKCKSCIYEPLCSYSALKEVSIKDDYST